MLCGARKCFLTVRLGIYNCSKIGLIGKSLLKGNCQGLLSIRLEGDLKWDILVMFLRPTSIKNSKHWLVLITSITKCLWMTAGLSKCTTYNWRTKVESKIVLKRMERCEIRSTKCNVQSCSMLCHGKTSYMHRRKNVWLLNRILNKILVLKGDLKLQTNQWRNVSRKTKSHFGMSWWQYNQ